MHNTSAMQAATKFHCTNIPDN